VTVVPGTGARSVLSCGKEGSVFRVIGDVVAWQMFAGFAAGRGMAWKGCLPGGVGITWIVEHEKASDDEQRAKTRTTFLNLFSPNVVFILHLFGYQNP